jgi:hypothetical protein
MARRYEKSPRIADKEPKPKEEKGGKGEKPDGAGKEKPEKPKTEGKEAHAGEGGAKPSETAPTGTEDAGIPIHARHAMERAELHHRHMREHAEMHHRHEREHAEARMGQAEKEG